MTEQEQSAQPEVNRYWEKLGILTASLKEIYTLIQWSFKVKQVACLVGEAGIGKTQIFRQIADDLGYDVLYYYLAHLEREDIGGIPMPTEDKTRYRFLCEESIREVIDSTKPTILVLDEWNRGEKPVMNAAFTLMEQRRFGSYTLPDHVFLGAAMNPSEGSYLVNEAEKDPAFRRRLCFVGVRADAAVWLEYATGRGDYHNWVTEYISEQPQHLIDVHSRAAGKVHANPAAWEKVSNIYKMFEADGLDIRTNTHLLRIMLAGIVGAGITEAHLDWLNNHATAINPMDVIKRYKAKARKKVQALAKEGRNDTLMEVCEAVALRLAVDKVDPEICAENIGMFAEDLPEDGAMAFFNKITKHLQELGDRAEYKMTLARALSNVPSYREALIKIHESHERVEEEITNGKGAS